MKLPNPDKAIIPREKIHDYLLSPIHSIGRHKAGFFNSLGYTQDGWQTLEHDLREFLAEEARPTEDTEYGRKYEIRGSITGPAGRQAALVTVWIVLYGEAVARFVTAYPGD